MRHTAATLGEEPGVGGNRVTKQIVCQQRIRQLQESREHLPLPAVRDRQMSAYITLEKHVELFHATPAPPQQAAGFRVEGRFAQDCRSTIIFLISAMALAGFRSFGHTSVQFIIV
jgi:hypothetical protein